MKRVIINLSSFFVDLVKMKKKYQWCSFRKQTKKGKQINTWQVPVHF